MYEIPLLSKEAGNGASRTLSPLFCGDIGTLKSSLGEPYFDPGYEEEKSVSTVGMLLIVLWAWL
jgi:hypothetical protein